MKTQHTKITGTTFYCDRRTCDATLEIGAYYPSNHWKDGEMTNQHAADRGWSHWAGSRQGFYYCPDHGPTVDTMSRLW